MFWTQVKTEVVSTLFDVLLFKGFCDRIGLVELKANLSSRREINGIIKLC